MDSLPWYGQEFNETRELMGANFYPVSRGEASLKEGAQYIFIELQDVGYPGSTYTLMYRPQQDILAGFYFQATVKQTFEVIFVRAE